MNQEEIQWLLLILWEQSQYYWNYATFSHNEASSLLPLLAAVRPKATLEGPSLVTLARDTIKTLYHGGFVDPVNKKRGTQTQPIKLASRGFIPHLSTKPTRPHTIKAEYGKPNMMLEASIGSSVNEQAFVGLRWRPFLQDLTTPTTLSNHRTALKFMDISARLQAKGSYIDRLTFYEATSIKHPLSWKIQTQFDRSLSCDISCRRTFAYGAIGSRLNAFDNKMTMFALIGPEVGYLLEPSTFYVSPRISIGSFYDLYPTVRVFVINEWQQLFTSNNKGLKWSIDINIAYQTAKNTEIQMKLARQPRNVFSTLALVQYL